MADGEPLGGIEWRRAIARTVRCTIGTASVLTLSFRSVSLFRRLTGRTSAEFRLQADCRQAFASL
jgi:hypothetical protein